MAAEELDKTGQNQNTNDGNQSILNDSTTPKPDSQEEQDRVKRDAVSATTSILDILRSFFG